MTIAEVAKRYDLTPDTLRYYERVGLIPGVNRTSGGIRNYRDEDCRWIQFIKCMRGAGLPIETLIEYVRLFQLGDETSDSRKALLIEQRGALKERVSDMQNTLDRLNTKIRGYEDLIVPMEDELKPEK
ncbi:HTH-type transcriptional regulator AdhR [bioreactor metagenome]|uniref:HTH-type transcriptional regulator AdhR n=1 Tax=bioreactor metagenome TaxID=1076179 RepID=A0A645HT57_9ZZZZ